MKEDGGIDAAKPVVEGLSPDQIGQLKQITDAEPVSHQPFQANTLASYMSKLEDWHSSCHCNICLHQSRQSSFWDSLNGSS